MEIKSLGKNYKPGTQSFADGFLGPKGDVGFSMIFSYEKAKRIVESFGSDNVAKVIAGLDGDFSENSQEIYNGKEWVEKRDLDFYRNSIWATPIILVEFKDKPQEAFECWGRMDY